MEDQAFPLLHPSVLEYNPYLHLLFYFSIGTYEVTTDRKNSTHRGWVQPWNNGVTPLRTDSLHGGKTHGVMHKRAWQVTEDADGFMQLAVRLDDLRHV